MRVRATLCQSLSPRRLASFLTLSDHRCIGRLIGSTAFTLPLIAVTMARFAGARTTWPAHWSRRDFTTLVIHCCSVKFRISRGCYVASLYCTLACKNPLPPLSMFLVQALGFCRNEFQLKSLRREILDPEYRKICFWLWVCDPTCLCVFCMFLPTHGRVYTVAVF